MTTELPQPQQEPDWQEMGQRVFQQTFDLWINPEVERRRQRGIIDDSFSLWAIQVIFDPDLDVPVIRLNEEVKAVVQGRAKRAPIQEGELLMEDDIEPEIILLTTADPNAGHVTFMRYRDRWLISFDFRRNAGRVANVIAAAKEFLASATQDLEHGRLRPFCESLFAAAELTARGELIMLPDRTLLESRSHEHLISRYNLWGKLGNADAASVNLLNRLTELRSATRYLRGEMELTDNGARGMLEIARVGLARLESRAPTRFPAEKIREVLRARGSPPDRVDS